MRKPSRDGGLGPAYRARDAWASNWNRRRTARYLAGAAFGARPRIEGRPQIDNRYLKIGDDFLLWSHEATTRLGGGGRLVIGNRVFINSGALILAHNYVGIGDDVAIGLQAVVVDAHMHGVAGAPVRYETTLVGAGTWIGMRAIVLAGVKIGRRCIVGAGSVVTKDVDDDVVVAGNPARTVRALNYPPGCTKAWNNDWSPAYWPDEGRARHPYE